MPDPPSNPNLEYLESRWRRNPGSRIYLQLAEEYRRLQRHGDAVDVLTRGLADRPTDLSGLVVLSRCQLEVGALDEAASALEKVLARDPAHMVANKLMVDTQLQRGDAERADERLSFYRLLNDRDPEIDHFEYRLSQLQVSDTEVAPSEAPSEAPSTAPPESLAATNDGEPMFALDDQPAGAITLDLGPKAGTAAGNGLPFGDLLAMSDDAHWQQLAADGLFSKALAIRFGEAPSTVSTPAAAAPSHVAPSHAAPEPEPEPFDLSSTLGDVADPPESLLDPVWDDEVPAAAELLDASPAPVPGTSSLGLDAQIIEEIEEAEPTTPAGDGEELVPATVAMGDLYLEQGHHHEAESVFRRVLAAEPDNALAQQGLARVVEIDAAVRNVAGTSTASTSTATLPQESPASVGDARSGDDTGGEAADGEITVSIQTSEPRAEAFEHSRLLTGEPLPEGVTARKIVALQRYLSLIQEGRDHVS